MAIGVPVIIKAGVVTGVGISIGKVVIVSKEDRYYSSGKHVW